MTPEVSIIIVNWNGINFLPNCLRSIVENPPGVLYEIVVVDNDSHDGSSQWLRSDECRKMLDGANLRLIESGSNLGFGRANNLAFEDVRSRYLFILNPDTLVQAGAIDTLLNTLRSEERIGAVAPKIVNRDGSTYPSVRGFPPTPAKFIAEGFRWDKLLPKRILAEWLYGPNWHYAKRAAVPIFSGAAIMAKSEMIKHVGGFDPDFHMYGEDWEWCVRINRAGWKTVFEPEATIIHLGGQSSKQRWGVDRTWIKEVEGNLLFQRKTLGRGQVIVNVLTWLSVHCVYYVRNWLVRRDNAGESAMLRLQLATIRTLLRGPGK